MADGGVFDNRAYSTGMEMCLKRQRPTRVVLSNRFNSIVTVSLVSDTKALGKPEQQTVTYNRQPNSGLLLSVTDSASRQTALTYDAMGNMTSMTKLSGTSGSNATFFAYDPTFNSTKAVTDPLNHTTAIVADSFGNPIEITDPVGNTTSFTYNTAGQITSTTRPLGDTTVNIFNSGSLVAAIDPAGQIWSRSVDAIGRLPPKWIHSVMLHSSRMIILIEL